MITFTRSQWWQQTSLQTQLQSQNSQKIHWDYTEKEHVQY